VAEKRLQAIKEFTELGSGFKIAMRDLSIRGAGNLLGSQQHGFIDSVGFDLYAQMLQEAIDERQSGIKKDEIFEVEISIPYDAYLPDSYIPDGFQKIQMYKRIKAVENEKDYEDLVDELIDRFGNMPIEAERLMRISRMKVWAKLASVESIKEQHKQLIVKFSKNGTQTTNGAVLVESSMVYGRAVGFQMNANQQLLLSIDEKKTGTHHPFDVLEAMMKVLPDAQKEVDSFIGEQ
ncbi:MAG TPA: TRCF domain-containing protein, partial [Paenisporosarcina sp.]|nr:TRCF domain-containing protein [Paenisporosarcina sp.]